MRRPRSGAALATFGLAVTASCGPPPYRPSSERPKPVAPVPAPARWETYATSSLGPLVDGRRYVVLNGKLAWWEPTGEFVFGPATLPTDLGELYAAPTATGTALLAKSARPTHSSRFGKGPTKIYRFADDRRSATTLVHTPDSVRVLGSAFGALVVSGASPETWLLDVESGASRLWPGIARAHWIAFQDQQNGVGYFQGSGLQVTSDGGATFRPAALAATLAYGEISGYEWTTEGIVALGSTHVAGRSASATPFAFNPRTGVVTTLFERERPLERWLRGRPTGWEPGTWQTLEIAQRHGVLARDGGAFVTTKDTIREPDSGGTVFAHMDLATGFVDFMAEAAGRRCFLLGHDPETMWLGCRDERLQDAPYWVERVERTPEALRRALAAFPDETRVFAVHPRSVDASRGVGVNLAPGVTLFFGSCRSAERRGFDCLVDAQGETRDIPPSDDTQRVIAMGSDVVRTIGGDSELLVERLGADGRWERLAEASVPQVKRVVVKGAYEPAWGKLVAFVSDSDEVKAWRVEVDTAAGQSTVHELDRAPLFQMRGPFGVDVSGAYARRTVDGGRTWSEFDLLGEPGEYVDVSEVGVRFSDAWVMGWDAQKTMPTPPVAPPAGEATDHPYASSPPPAPPAGVLVCREANRPVPAAAVGREPPAALETNPSPDGATSKWELRWADAGGTTRKWSGEGPTMSAALRDFHAAGSTTAFVFDVGSSELVVGRAVGDKVEFSTPRYAETSSPTVRVGQDGAIAFGGVEAFVWPAGKPPEAIYAVVRVGAEIAIEASSPGFLTFSTSQTGHRAVYASDRYISVPNAPNADPPPLPALGWYTSSAFPLAWSTPCAAPPKATVRVAREARVLERYDRSAPPLDFQDIPRRTVVFEVGFDPAKPLDPATSCVASVTFPSNAGPDADWSFVTKKGSLYVDAVQPITCDLLSAADYPGKL